VNKVCQFLHAPTTHHWSAVKHILRYLCGTCGLGVRFAAFHLSYLVLSLMRIGLAVLMIAAAQGVLRCFLVPTYLHGVLATQATVSRSSTEAEYKALANATAEVIWIQTVLGELGIQLPRSPCLWCDNLEATYMTANPHFHRHTKHIEVDFHFVRECVAHKQLDV
jgi:hypothetical protein